MLAAKAGAPNVMFHVGPVAGVKRLGQPATLIESFRMPGKLIEQPLPARFIRDATGYLPHLVNPIFIRNTRPLG